MMLDENSMNEISNQELETIDGGIAPLVVGAVIILSFMGFCLGEAVGYQAGQAMS